MLVIVLITIINRCSCRICLRCCRTNLRLDSEYFGLLMCWTVHALVPLTISIHVLCLLVLLHVWEIFTKWSYIVISFINEGVFIESVCARSLFVISLVLFQTLWDYTTKIFSIGYKWGSALSGLEVWIETRTLTAALLLILLLSELLLLLLHELRSAIFAKK